MAKLMGAVCSNLAQTLQLEFPLKEEETMDAPVLLKNFVEDSRVVAEAGAKLDVFDPAMGERFGGVA
jgi:hypothetical protein